MSADGIAARATDSRIATAPRSTSERSRNAEPYFPTGVLTAETITERVMDGLSRCFSVGSGRDQPARTQERQRRRFADVYGAPRHRGGAVRAVDRCLRSGARHRDGDRGPADGVL